MKFKKLLKRMYGLADAIAQLVQTFDAVADLIEKAKEKREDQNSRNFAKHKTGYKPRVSNKKGAH